MKAKGWYRAFARSAALLALFMVACAQVRASSPEQLLERLNEFPHAQQVSFSQREVVDYEVGLGAMKKVSGAWRFKHSERISGLLTAYTWQIVDGFTSLEVMGNLMADVAALENSDLLFSCEGRACGQGVQWANRVFHQRILYGREDMQRYRVYTLAGEDEYRLIIYSSARTADRQYLHGELLKVLP